MEIQNKISKIKPALPAGRSQKFERVGKFISFFFFIFLFEILSLTFNFSADAATGVNKQINFQGKLVNSDGTNVTDNTYSVVFTLYDASSGGTNLWDETQNVTTVDGIFQVSLGSVDTTLGDVNFNQDNLYLGIKVGADSEMTPRIRFAAVPYALNAAALNGVTATQSATGFTLTGGSSTAKTLTVNDDLTLGLTITPTSSNGLTILSNGANSLRLDSGSSGTMLIGDTNATTITFGRSGGAITLPGFATNNNSVLYTGGSGALSAATTTTAGLCLVSAANTPGWANCPSNPTWNVSSANGLLHTGNTTVDVLFGGVSTASAKFAFINNAGGTPVASLSANNGNNKTFLTGAGNLGTTNAQTLTLGGAATGTILLQPNGDTTNSFRVRSNGSTITIGTSNASALTVDTGGAAALNLGTGNATSAVLGSSSLGSFTVTTDSTGNGEVVLPGQSIGAGEILNDTIDYTEISDTPTLDANTTVSLSTLNYIFDLTSTGEFFIRDAGTNFAQFLNDGTITLGKSSAATSLNLGIGTGADTINIGTNNTVGDTLVIGNTNAATTLALTSGTAWSISGAGAAVLGSVTGAGLSDCDAADSKVLWNDATGTFSCGTEQSGSGANVQSNIAAIGDTTLGGTTTLLATATITPTNNSGDVIVRMTFSTRSLSNTDQTITGEIRSGANCSGTLLASNTTSLTSSNGANGPSVFVMYLQTDAGNTSHSYSACALSSVASGAGSTGGIISAEVIDTSPSSGGGGNVAVRESDGSPSLSTATTIEFGPATSSDDEFVVTDQGSSIARVRLGTKVGMLNEAETVTGGWTFNTAITTFTTSVAVNGGITTATDTSLTLGAAGTGNIILSTDANTGVRIGSASNTPAVLSISGGIGSNAAFIVDQLNSTGNLIAASASGSTKFVVDNSGNVTAGGGLTFSGSGGISLSTGSLAFSNTGSITLTGGTISDATDEVDIADDLAVAGNISLTGTTGLTFSGTGADITFTNGEQLSNDTDGTLTFRRNDAGTVTLVAADDDATAALTIQSGGAAALTLDTGGAAILGIGTTNASAVTLGNTGSSTSVTLTKGASGNLTLTGFNCTSYTNGGVLTTDASGNIVCQNDDGGAATATYWDSAQGAIFPNNTTYDFLLGGVSTASAKFAFMNVNNGATPVASISAPSGTTLILNGNGSVTTNSKQTLTLGGGNSGEVYVGSLLKIDPSMGIKGGGLSDCSSATTSKLLWDASTNRFSCGTDQGGGGGSSMTVRESDSSPAVSAVAVLEFGPGTTSSDEFIVTDEGGNVARVRIGNQVGMLNEAETVTGGWTFNTAATTFTTGITANGGLTTATNTNLALTAAGTGKIVLTTDADTGVYVGTASNAPAILSVAGGMGSNALAMFNQTNSGDILSASASGVTKFTIKNDGTASTSGNLVFDGASTIQSTRNQTLTLGGSTTGSLVLYSDFQKGVLIGSANNTIAPLSVSGGIGSNALAIFNQNNLGDIITASSSGVSQFRITNTGLVGIGRNITPVARLQVTGGQQGGNAAVIIDQIGVSTNDIFAASASGVTKFVIKNDGTASTSAGLTINAAGSIQSTNAQTLTIGGNTTGGIVFQPNQTTNSLRISGGSAIALTTNTTTGLTLDTGTTGSIAIGTNANAKTITIGNTTSSTGLVFDTGTGGINIGDNANTKVIEIGGVDNNGADTVRIATNATSADSITIGNSNASTTMALTGGTAWSISTAGAASFVTGAFTGQISAANTGIEFTESDTNPTCSSGNFNIYADLSENKLKKCQNGTVTDLDTTSSITVKSGTVSVTEGTPVTVNFGTAFSTTPYCAVSVDLSGAGSGTQGEAWLTAAPTTTQITIDWSDNGGGAGKTENMNWICTSAGNADLAEVYATNDTTVMPGDVVSLDSALKAGVKKSTKAYDKQLFGIVSTAPAISIGGVEDPDARWMAPVALSGRVPVKVSTENGPIKAGDLLTSSSVPGVAMKATQPGFVLGQAMADFDGDGVGLVLTFVKNEWYDPHASLISARELTLARADVSDATSAASFTLFDGTGETITRVGAFSEAVIGNVQAGYLDVAENITAGMLTVGHITTGSLSVTTENITIGGVTIREYLAGIVREVLDEQKQQESQTGLALLETGITNQESRITDLETLFATTSAQSFVIASESESISKEDQIASSSSTPRNDELAVNSLSVEGLATISANLRVKSNTLIEGMLTVIDTLMTKDLIVNGLATFFDDVVFKGNVAFAKTPTFSKDTAGFAIIKKGSTIVDVVFEEEYKQTPVVNASISFESISNNVASPVSKSDEERQQELEEAVLGSHVTYIITKRTTKGFSIQLNKPVEEDITFSWTAFAVDKPVTYQSKEIPSPTPTLPIQSGTSQADPTSPSGLRGAGKEVSD